MSPIFAESLRVRLAWLLALLIATVVAFVMLRPEPPPTRDYKEFKRVGKCIDGKWVFR